MTEKIKQWSFILLFFAMLILPSVVWPLGKDSLAGENSENRNLAEKPEFSLEGIEEYPALYEKYYNDALPFRSQLIRWNSQLGYGLFGDVLGSDAVVGEAGWMFYRPQTDGDPMSNYMGRKLFDQNELEAIARNLVDAQQLLQEQGIRFVVMIAPNKERVYAEYMPAYYGEPAELYAVKQLVTYLQENTEVPVVYVQDALMEAKSQLPEIPLYYKMDTHWNNVGAYVGARELLAELGVEMPSLQAVTIRQQEKYTTYTDLVNMLSLQQEFPQEKEYDVTGYDRNGLVEEEKNFFGVYRYHSEAEDTGKLFVIRDSFCSAMAEYLASQFSESVMVHRDAYSYDQLKEAAPDIVVLELVERNAPDLIHWWIE